jgi:hypothetical protein
LTTKICAAPGKRFLKFLEDVVGRRLVERTDVEIDVRAGALVIADHLQPRLTRLLPEAAHEAKALVRGMGLACVALEAGYREQLVGSGAADEEHVHAPAHHGVHRAGGVRRGKLRAAHPHDAIDGGRQGRSIRRHDGA